MCFFKLIKVHLLVSELYIYQNARCNDKKKIMYNYMNYFTFLLFYTSCANKYTDSGRKNL